MNIYKFGAAPGSRIAVEPTKRLARFRLSRKSRKPRLTDEKYVKSPRKYGSKWDSESARFLRKTLRGLVYCTKQ